MREEVFLKNLTIYRNEIWSITQLILNQKVRLINSDTFKRSLDPANHLIDPHPEPHEIISIILNGASRLHKLFEVANKRSDETEKDYQFRKDRSKYLKDRFLSKCRGERELFKTKARNSIEHFDERTDLLMNALIEKETAVEGKFVLYNMSLSSKEIFQPWDKVLPIKVFVNSTMEYFITNNEMKIEQISLNKIFSEIEKIQQKVITYVEKHFEPESAERLGPIGAWIPINETTHNQLESSFQK